MYKSIGYPLIVVFLYFVCGVCVCVWATMPDLNKMEWNGME